MNFLNTTAFKPSLLLAMSLGLFACGGDKPNNSNAPSTESTTTTTTETTATVNNLNTKTLTVAVTSAFAPFTFSDEKGSLTGFDIDLLDAIAQNKGLNLQYKPTSFDGIFTEIDAGTSDIAASGIFYQEERASKYGVTKPYHNTQPVYFYLADNAKLANTYPTTKSDLNAHTLNIATVSDGDVEGLGNQHNINKVQSEFLGFQGVLQGKYDVAFSDTGVLNHIIKNNLQGKESLLKIVPYQDKIGFIFVIDKENTQLLNTLNEGIEELTQSGKLKQLEEKYGLSD